MSVSKMSVRSRSSLQLTVNSIDIWVVMLCCWYIGEGKVCPVTGQEGPERN